MKIEIEKGIPIPMVSKYPFAEMEVGDSFFLTDKQCKNDIIIARSTIYNTVRAYKRKSHTPSFKVKAKAMNGGLRVWRTA